MRNSLLAAVAALTLAAPAAAQTSSTDLQMPVAPAGLGERITMGTQTFEPPPAAAYGLAASQLTAAQVRQLQQGLRAQGFPLSRIDGRFGPETAGAVQNFQQRQNIASVPGQIDARTLGLLGVGVAPAQPRVGAPGPGGESLSSGLSTPLAGTATRRGVGLGGGRGALPSGYGAPMSPPSTPGLDAPGNNGMNPDASMSTPNVTRPPGARTQ